MLTFLTLAAVEDVKEMRISNRLILSGLIWGLVYRVMGAGAAGIIHFLVNSFIPVILLYLLFQMRILGAGDIKLFSIVGAFCTVRGTLYVILTAFLAAAVVGAGKIFYLKKTTGYHFGDKTRIHFSIFILLGYCIAIWGCLIE